MTYPWPSCQDNVSRPADEDPAVFRHQTGVQERETTVDVTHLTLTTLLCQE